MNIHFKITLDAPKGGLRRLGLFVALPLGIVAATGLIASATLNPPPSTWAVPDAAIKSAPLASNLNALDERLSALEGVAPCPAGYAQEDAGVPYTNEIVACLNTTTNDQVVKVGTGASAFWIDRYEATAWTSLTGGTQIPDSSITAYEQYIPANGQTTTPLYALSVAGEYPSRALTWFQAVELCRASGKRLPTGEEWLAAARGTPNAGVSDGYSTAQCNTYTTSTLGVRASGRALGATHPVSCVSDWGAEDMVGNVAEWTSEWYAGLSVSSSAATQTGAWPNAVTSNFYGNATWNIASFAYTDNSLTWSQNVPAAALRGGAFNNGASAGVFALNLNFAPSGWGATNGFRCVLPGGH